MMGRAVVVGFLLLVFAATAGAQASATGDFVGRWVVTDVVGYDEQSGGIPEAKRLLGMALVVTKDDLRFDREKCKPRGGFKLVEVDSAVAALKYYAVAASDMGLPAKTTLLESEECTPVFRVDAHRVAFGWNGVVVRAVSDVTDRSK